MGVFSAFWRRPQPKPPRRAAAAPRMRQRAAPERGPLARILICEDDPPTLLQLRLTFEQFGCDVETEIFGSRLVAKLLQGEVDLVLLDYQLAAGDASEFWPRLPEWERLCVPSVLMSAEDHRAEAQALGCLAFYEKPITMEKAQEILRRFVVGGGRARPNPSTLPFEWDLLASRWPAA